MQAMICQCMMVMIPGAGNDGDGNSCNLVKLTMMMKVEIIFMMMGVDG